MIVKLKKKIREQEVDKEEEEPTGAPRRGSSVKSDMFADEPDQAPEPVGVKVDDPFADIPDAFPKTGEIDNATAKQSLSKELMKFYENLSILEFSATAAVRKENLAVVSNIRAALVSIDEIKTDESKDPEFPTFNIDLFDLEKWKKEGMSISEEFDIEKHKKQIFDLIPALIQKAEFFSKFLITDTAASSEKGTIRKEKNAFKRCAAFLNTALDRANESPNKDIRGKQLENKINLKNIILESIEEVMILESELGEDTAELEDGTPVCEACIYESLTCGCQDNLGEAKYHGKSVPLGKPMRGDVKKFKVYVRDPKTGNVKKVNFGDKKMRIKKSNPKRRKSFRARHHCENPGPRTKARYWSCRKW